MIGNRISQLRKQNGMSQEELAEKMGVSRQSVSKWESGQSVPEVEKLVQLSDLFHVSTDYLLKEDTVPDLSRAPVQEEPFRGMSFQQEFRKEEEPRDPEYAEQEVQETEESWKDTWKKTVWNTLNAGPKEEGCYILRKEEAEDFMKARERKGKTISQGVAECVSSPAPVIVLSTLGAALMPAREAVFAVLGVSLTMAMIAHAVSGFMRASVMDKAYHFLKTTPFLPEFDAEDAIREACAQMPEKNHDDIRTAVFLFILCPVPVILLSVLSGGNSFMEGLGVGMLLGMVAEGVRRCVLAGMRGETMKRLFQKDEYRPEAKRRMNFKDLYWALITGAYFLYSALSGSWGISWVIFVLGGIAYPFIERMSHT